MSSPPSPLHIGRCIRSAVAHQRRRLCRLSTPAQADLEPQASVSSRLGLLEAAQRWQLFGGVLVTVIVPSDRI